jgi:hypothetical protein
MTCGKYGGSSADTNRRNHRYLDLFAKCKYIFCIFFIVREIFLPLTVEIRINKMRTNDKADGAL